MPTAFLSGFGLSAHDPFALSAPALLSVSGLCRLLKFGPLRADDKWAAAAVDESRRLMASDAHRQCSRDCPSDVKPRRES